MGNTRQKNLEIQKKNQNELRKLEQFYVEGKVDTMLQEVEAKKQELVEDMKKYAERHTRPSKFDKKGNPIAYKIDINPLIITNYFCHKKNGFIIHRNMILLVTNVIYGLLAKGLRLIRDSRRLYAVNLQSRVN